MMRAPVIALALAAAVTGCKKDEKKPAAKVADAAAAKPAAPPPEAAAAISGFKSVAASSGGGGGGAFGGIGGKLGDLFGGGAAPAAAAAPAEADDMPAEAPPSFTFPPAAPKGGDCDAVAERLVLVIKAYIAAEMNEMTPEEQQMARGMIDSMVADMRPEMLSMCKDEGWSQELRDCALTATSVADFEACDKLAPPEPAAAPPPSKPVPAWSGGKECKDVGARLKQLTLATADTGDLPPGTVEQLDDYAAQLTAACTEGQWSEAARTCMVNAPTLDDIGNCFGAL
jgi:hypothetical protein